MEYSFEDKLSRILRCSFPESIYEIDRNLVHAYIACLTVEELGEAICRTLDHGTRLRMAIRNRLVKVARQSDGKYADQLAALIDKTRDLHGGDAALRTRIDALHSALYEFLPLPTRQAILDGWVDRGSRGAAARWLKAIKDDKPLFDGHAIFSYWRATGDERAAKILAYNAEAGLLDEILPELARLCDEGWIISKAALRASSIPEEVWAVVRERHPASYAYMCAQSGRTITEEEAFAIIRESPDGFIDDPRGLAIWSIGQMGMISVLDRIGELREEFAAEHLASLRARIPSLSGDPLEADGL